MITRISSVNYVGGGRYRHQTTEDTVYNILQSLDGLKGFKMYLDESNPLLPILNIVIMLSKDYEIMDTLDGSLDKISERMENQFRFSREKMFLFIIWK